MIEVPRAAIVADKIAEYADFFSFGTNDLTQMAYGYSRDDATKFMKIYLEKGILNHDPFEILDPEGVGELVKMGTEKGRKYKSLISKLESVESTVENLILLNSAISQE